MKNVIQITGLISVTLIVFLFSSCEKDFYVPPTLAETPDTVSFVANIVPLFNASCNMIGCHHVGGIPPDLSANNAYNDLLQRNLIDTNNPELSILYTKMTSKSNPMPPSGVLASGEPELVLKWIQQGALNN